jgi:hypothetical protein
MVSSPRILVVFLTARTDSRKMMWLFPQKLQWLRTRLEQREHCRPAHCTVKIVTNNGISDDYGHVVAPSLVSHVDRHNVTKLLRLCSTHFQYSYAGKKFRHANKRFFFHTVSHKSYDKPWFAQQMDFNIAPHCSIKVAVFWDLTLRSLAFLVYQITCYYIPESKSSLLFWEKNGD